MRRRWLFARLGVVGVLLTAVLAPTPAQSISASLSAVDSPVWQTNASVQGLAVAAGKAYAGGRFTSVRPPGSPLGTNEVGQAYLAAFDAATGDLVTSFTPVLNGQVYAVAASPDGSRIFVGGDFTTVNGVTRNRIAAFDTATGALLPDWKPSVSYRVKTIAVAGGTVYFGGSFGLVNGQERLRLAAVSATAGTLLPWAPATDGDVYAVEAADDGSKVYAGGQFSTVNGTSQNTVSSLDPATGAVLPFPAASAVPPPNGTCTTRVKTIDASGDTVYFGNGGDGVGCFDGTWAADIATGVLKWKNQCLGATEAVKVVNGWLYKGSHAHDCAYNGAGGFPQGFGYRFLLTESLTDGSIGPWFPNTNAGAPTEVGPLAFASGGSDLWVGGDFTTTNGVGQQGLTRFTNTAPGAAPAKPAKLQPYSVKPGEVKIHFPTVVDNDDSTLTYRLLKGFSNTTIATWTATSTPWERPWLHYTDTAVTPGEVTNYRVEVTDGTTTVRGNYSDPITVAGTTATAYDELLKADGPQAFWRLGEASGTTTSVDASGQSNNGTYTGVTLGTAGAIAGNTAATTTSSGRMVGEKGFSMPQQFTVEAWVKQSSLRGGRIIGFGGSRTGNSSGGGDRMLYLRSNGAIIFGVNDGSQRTLTSTSGKNDSQWHHVVGTYDNGAMKLYVDGVLAGSQTVGTAALYYGWWRVGYDNISSWAGGGATQTGMVIDEAAVYPYALDAGQVQAHYDAR
ncbi:LamG domain protein jellyroll fold domain protein [Kribbella flavida DSM 17836]|uniref:LamG domain protein jellyroll fold domain protein n=1 Tax=Kribbella flavida (strain DSM 17836 / JCM 10339 / NBRC 14399) TaxID=479435 RepID=D2PZ19_KRIFD|nr:LamG-like jellyroll fold domain-containing protein [Kribbella flavida]ADB31813.1 LamG domain protein jellyroll fold domain protein [Kribbella flavida DSM 17836]